MKLYELDKAIESFELEIDEDTGEIKNADELDAIEMEREQKQINVGLYIKNLEAEAKAIRDEEKRLKQRREAVDKQVEWYKGYLYRSLDGDTIHKPNLLVTYRKSDRVEITDEALVPEEYWKVKREISKADLKKALKQGEIKGAELKEYQTMQVK